MAWTCLLIFCLLSICKGASEECKDCTIKPHLPCSITKYTDKSECLAIEQEEGPYPSDPVNVKITSVYKGLPGVLKSPSVEVTWTPPQDGSHEHLKGFMVILTAEKHSWPNWSQCHYYNLSSAEWTNEDQTLQYNYTCTSYLAGIIHVQVFSIPNRDFKYTSAEFNFVARESLSTDGTISTGQDWVAPIFYRYNCSRALHVGFNFNASLDFDTYTIRLKVNDTMIKKVVVKHEPSKVDGWGVFSDVDPGTYSLSMVPRGNSCIVGTTNCGEIEYQTFDITYDSARCEPTVTSIETSTMGQTNPTSPREQVTTSDKITTIHPSEIITTIEEDTTSAPRPESGLGLEKIMGIVIGIVMAILVSSTLILLIVCRRNHRAYDCTKKISAICRKSGGYPEAAPTNQTELENVNLQNKVCILNISKEIRNQDIMKALAGYLKTSANLDLFTSNLVEEAERSKLVILLHYDKDKEELEAVRAIGEMKLIHVYFGFSAPQCVRQISGDNKYLLMHEMETFLTHLQSKIGTEQSPTPSGSQAIYVQEYWELKGCIDATEDLCDSGLGDPYSLPLSSLDSDTQLSHGDRQSFTTINLMVKPPVDDTSIVSPDFRSDVYVADSVSCQFQDINASSGDSRSLGGESV